MHRLLSVPVALSMTLSSVATQSPQPLPQNQTIFRAATTLVPVDVRVVDRNGRPVTDLREADFTVLENGVPQRIEHFSTQALVAEPPPAGSSTRPTRAADALEFASLTSRTFLIVLGRGRLQVPSGGVDAAIHLVKDVALPQDHIAVLAWNRATDFSTERSTTQQALERFRAAHEGLEARIVLWEKSLQYWSDPRHFPDDIQRDIDAVFGGARSARTMAGNVLDARRIEEQNQRVVRDALSNQPMDPIDQAEFNRQGGTLDDFMQQSSQTAQDLTALYLGVEYLRHLAGEKHLVFISEYGISLPSVEHDRGLGRQAADARVVIDMIEAGGLPFSMGPRGASGGRGFSFATPGGYGLPQAMTARNLVKLTGGSFHAHEFGKSSQDIDAIDAVSRFEYLLGYSPANPALDGTYRQITVKVNRPGLTVLYRDGYFARRELRPLEGKAAVVSSRVMAAAAYDRPIPDLSIAIARATVQTSGALRQVHVDLHIDLRRVFFENTNGVHRVELEVAVFCVDGHDRTVSETWKTIQLTYTQDRLAIVKRDGFDGTLVISVKQQPANVKVVVYDYAADLAGSAVAQIK